MRYAEVVFNIPLEKSFHYLVPPTLTESLQPGMRALVPFGPRVRIGFVVQRLPQSPVKNLKAIRRVIDPVPVVSDDRWALASWLTTYYCCSLGEALSLMVPSTLRLPARFVEAAGPASTTTMDEAAPRILTAHQRRALTSIVDALESRRSEPILVHGVTGSGKTELYLRAVERVLAQGRSAICLIPEIALTPQTVERFRERFTDRVAVWHSRLTARQRSLAWSRLATGQCRVVVGARSAVFAPVRDLGLIILDEEHEPSYKQEGAPHTHAREVAAARGRLTRASVLLGSATPSVETYYAATQGPGRLVELPERVQGRSLPSVEIVDLRHTRENGRSGGPFSPRLRQALEGVVERGEQAMLLLNRRGFARTVQCHACGVVVRCRRCAVPLVYHALRQQLVCHYCNFQEPPAEVCGACKKGYLRFRGSGTERIESELHRLFPVSAIGRMDRDTTKSRDSHRQLYEAVKRRQIHLLVGTQMIAKGLDFPQVTLVGVVSADTALNLPDFRSGERTFDLLTQMAGRAGRGEQPGRVVIQTYCPNHYAIQAARRHDYQAFYEEEIRMRRRVNLPPFVHLVELTLRGSSRRRVEAAAAVLVERLRHGTRRARLPAAPNARGQRRAAQAGVVLLGPAPHRIPRLRGAYQICVLMKGRAVEPMVALLRATVQSGRRFGGMPVSVDVDPL